MRKQNLGCLSINAMISTVITLGVIAVFMVATGNAMFSPGRLNDQSDGPALGGVASHAEAGADCGSCHAPFWDFGGMTERCQDCHTDLVEMGDDFHVVMSAQGQDVSCQRCHTEHNGDNAPLTRMELKNFPHDEVGFSLRLHTQTYNGLPVACVDCHPSTFSRPGNATCIDCHLQYQPQIILAHTEAFPGDCINCHDGIDRFHAFDHSRTGFALLGGHQETSCQDCHHNAGTLNDLMDLSQACRDCHAPDDPHAAQFAAICENCHTAAGWSPSIFDHQSVEFVLTGEHVQTTCTACHNSFGDSGERRYAGIPDACFDCHNADEPHGGRFGAACQDCHTTAAWYPAAFDHVLSDFKLEGWHVLTACEACHNQHGPNGRPRYASTPTDCSTCHQDDDAHAGELGTGCLDCHTPLGWAPSTYDHARSAFQLTGAHVQAACQVCHIRDLAAGRLIFTGTPVFCAGCHTEDDPHSRQFGLECQTCHTTSAWLPSTFDHDNTSFQLTGAHVNTSCQSCHTQGWRGTPTACAACHREPGIHAGVFGTSCQDCHTTAAWLPASYNGPHSFPKNHGRANSCRDCHPSSYAQWTCYTCHDKGEIANEHRDEGIGNINNCLRCHPDGREDDRGDDDDD